MNYGFVVGNGESRKNFDLNLLLTKGPIYGCNALYRDFTPTVLFARDTPMIQEIKENYVGIFTKYVKPYIHYNNNKIKIPHNIVLAGSVALWCMCNEYLNKLDHIFLLGFDPFPSLEDGGKNNIYKNTSNYGSNSESASPRVSQCIADLNFIFRQFKQLFSFTLVGQFSPDLMGCEFMGYQDFKAILNLKNY